MISNVKKIVLAYSGGLDTSVILKWLQLKYKCEVVTFTADLGQGEELQPVRAKAESLGVQVWSEQQLEAAIGQTGMPARALKPVELEAARVLENEKKEKKQPSLFDFK